MVASRQTACPEWRNSRKFRLSPPSNRISATPIETIVSSKSPNAASGSNRLSTGPAMKPANSIRTIAGQPLRQAIH